MLVITEYTVTKPRREHFVIKTPDATYISSGGMIWWKQAKDNMIEVIPSEDEQYLSKLLHGHEVLERLYTE